MPRKSRKEQIKDSSDQKKQGLVKEHTEYRLIECKKCGHTYYSWTKTCGNCTHHLFEEN